MTSKTIHLIWAATALGLLSAGLAGGHWWARRNADHAHAGTASTTSADGRQVLYWYDPMMPDQRFDRPGKSPFMDMQLVPKYVDEGADGGVRIESGLQQSVGIRTAEVTTGSLALAIRVPGTLAWDLRQESVVSARVEGLLSRVQVKTPYTIVRRGQPLAAVLAPDWSSALAEAQALQDAESGAARDLQAAARQRLRVLGVPGGMSRSGESTLSAPRDGVVTEVLAREGQTVEPGTPLFRINGLDTLWLEAAIPQAVATQLRPGAAIEASVSALPGEILVGHVEALLPQVDATSRTQQARIVLNNPGRRLAPGMFAEVLLQPERGAPVPMVPTEALIATGNQSRVIVQGPDGSFRPVPVRIGRSAQGLTEIVAGLAGGERVVVSGQFLIDSEASLSGALQRLGEASPSHTPTPTLAPTPTPTHEQGTHDAHASSTAVAIEEGDAMSSSDTRPASPAARACPVLHWYDPMVPDKHFDRPGKSPFMDMQLVPKFAPDAALDCAARDALPADKETQP